MRIPHLFAIAAILSEARLHNKDKDHASQRKPRNNDKSAPRRRLESPSDLMEELEGFRLPRQRDGGLLTNLFGDYNFLLNKKNRNINPSESDFDSDVVFDDSVDFPLDGVKLLGTGREKNILTEATLLAPPLVNILGQTAVLGQVASAITTTSQEFLDTAIQGNKLLKADAKLALGNIAIPLYSTIQEDARVIGGKTKALAESLGIETMKDDAKKVMLAAADVVVQGEQNLAEAFKDWIPPIILKQQ